MRSPLADRSDGFRRLLLLLPGIAFFVVLMIYPIVKLALIGLYDWKFNQGFASRFVGLGNFAKVLADPAFVTVLTNTLVYALVTVPAQMALGLFFAVLIRAVPWGGTLFRVGFYLPVVTSWVIVSLLFKFLFNTEGAVNAFLKDGLGWIQENVAWLDDRWTGLGIAGLLGIWKGVGWNVVIFYAALLTVPKEQYEAAQIDGCNAWAQFRKVTLPGIRSTVLFALVMLTIGAFNVFTSIKLITDGRPAHQTDVVLTFLYFKAFDAGNYGYSAALSFMVAALIAAMAIVQFRVFGKGERS